MSKEFAARRLDLKSFAEHGGPMEGQQRLQEYQRLLAEAQGRGADLPVCWSVNGELRNPGHVNPEVWLHLRAHMVLPLTCQRCLGPVDVPVAVDRSFRFVADEDVAAAQDEEAQEDVLALSRSFNLVELVEDELLMALPLAPRHDECPEPVSMSAADAEFDGTPQARENPFAVLGKLKSGKS